jgi:hypothetical protein
MLRIKIFSYPGYDIFTSRIRLKIYKYFNLKKGSGSATLDAGGLT